jgi:hypothetical protein
VLVNYPDRRDIDAVLQAGGRTESAVGALDKPALR